MRLLHFSDDGTIERFEPQPVKTPSERGPGREWLNGPLVWGIAEDYAAMYLFPRECPRILIWATAQTTEEDRHGLWGRSEARIIAHIEWEWFEALTTGRLWRYTLPVETFEDLSDAGMWVSRTAVEPRSVHLLKDLPGALADAGVELRVLPSLAPLKDLWDTSVHASGIRLRNARSWVA
ncbi:DUF6886 family protein [Phenylobacterium immobile]|uniref:DUF6886 family protein n=1 Tax=Phenylobacterium immobile TaxID=21 RepID=UPI000B22A1F3|nr:DUF6886 family protein [Phenylobacterium immobile]